MASKTIHIKKTKASNLKKKLEAISGSFKLNDSNMENGDLLLSINPKVPNYHLLVEALGQDAEVSDEKPKDLLNRKNLKIKTIRENI